MHRNYLDESTTVEVVNPTFRAVVQEGGLENLPTYLHQQELAADRAFVLTDTNVNNLYGERLGSVLEAAGIETTFMTMPAGEEYKTYEQAGSFIDQLSDAKVNRNDTIIAMGGGVIGDLGGFVASVYNRGVALVHVPTTLLAMVDSSIGGKTGVDKGGKNKTGTFHQPSLVVADPTVLATLGGRVYTEGFGEIAKYGVLDANFFPRLELLASTVRDYSSDSAEALAEIIARSIKQKIDVIKADPFEKEPGGRILLNYGHTLGHGLEAAGGYSELLHGEAVSIGMMYAAQLAVRLGLADSSFVDRQEALLRALDLPTRYTGAAKLEDILDHVAKDKKNTGGDTTRFVLPAQPGDLRVVQVDNSAVRSTVAEFLAA